MGKTKEEIEEEINAAFPLSEDIKWSNLTKEDLLLIRPLLSNPRQFIRAFMLERGEEKVADVLITAKHEIEEASDGAGEEKIGSGKLISKILDSVL